MAVVDNDRVLLEAINAGDEDSVRALLDSGGADAKAAVDEQGTSALQQAAFKGQTAICRLLMERGADVNSTQHRHGYTALMFAALSGQAQLCRLLLEAGAEPAALNSIGRTAAGMASFTGQHHCVSVINNFLPLADVDAVVRPKSSLDSPRLPAVCVAPLHELLRSYNLHPVHIILFLTRHQQLLVDQKSLLFVLEGIFENQMKRKETNEVMALKVHIIMFIVAECCKLLQKERQETDKSDCEILTLFAKKLLVADSGGCARGLESLLRRAVQKFPYHHCVLFQTMVRTLSQTPVGSEPSALSVVRQSLLGQRMLMDEAFCVACGHSPAPKRCASCKRTTYCSADCQKLHWFAHRRDCAPPSPPPPRSDVRGSVADADAVIEEPLSQGRDAAPPAQPKETVDIADINLNC